MGFRKKISIKVLLLSVLIIVLLLINMMMITTAYTIEYIVLIAVGCITMGMFFFTYNGDIFQPHVIATALYMGIFVICPIYLISIGDTTCHGAYVMDGCIKASIIYIIGYTSMLTGLGKKALRHQSKSEVKINKQNFHKSSYLLLVSYAIWIVCWVISTYIKVRTGTSLSYIISFGLSGSKLASFNSFGDEGGIAFLGKLANSMIIPWLVICVIGNNKLLKIIVTLLTFASYYITGFRYMILIMAISGITVYYRVENKKPTKKTIILFLTIAVLGIALVGFGRASIRSGRKVDWTEFSSEAIEYSLVSNFNIFLPFYGVVTKYPWTYMYTFGHSMFIESLLYFIPRAIWSGKPVAKTSSSVAIAIMNSTNEFTIQVVGMAWPNIGEYYMEFGVVGVIVFMYILGRIMRKSLNLYNSSDVIDVITYGVFLGVVFQVVTRGYMPNNMGFLLFLFLPLLPIRFVCAMRKSI